MLNKLSGVKPPTWLLLACLVTVGLVIQISLTSRTSGAEKEYELPVLTESTGTLTVDQITHTNDALSVQLIDSGDRLMIDSPPIYHNQTEAIEGVIDSYSEDSMTLLFDGQFVPGDGMIEIPFALRKLNINQSFSLSQSVIRFEDGTEFRIEPIQTNDNDDVFGISYIPSGSTSLHITDAVLSMDGSVIPASSARVVINGDKTVDRGMIVFPVPINTLEGVELTITGIREAVSYQIQLNEN